MDRRRRSPSPLPEPVSEVPSRLAQYGPPSPLPSCSPDRALEGRRWRWRGQLLSVQRAGRGHLESLDREWDLFPAPIDDESAHWRFARIGTTRPERFVVRDQAGHYLGGWLDHSRLISVPTAAGALLPDAYRLDFLRVRPDIRGLGLGVQILGLIAMRASERGAHRLVLQSLDQARGFFENRGAKPSRWRGAQALANLEFDDLGRLMEVLDGEVR